MANNNIRFMTNNFAALTAGQITASSELSSFPKENATNVFRSKLWKPSGHFLIDDTNNKLYINDGTQKTVTLVNASYTTPELLADHIETQLNLSSSGWSVDYNNSVGEYKFRIVHASAHVLEVSNPTNATWSAIGFTGSSDITINTAATASEQRNHTSEYITYDFGFNASVEFFAALGPLGENFSPSNTATIKLYANNLNEWNSPPLDITLENSAEGILEFLEIEDTGYRYWRLEITDKYNPGGPQALSIGHLYLGDYLTLVARNIKRDFAFKINDPTETTQSEAGALYFDKRTKFHTFSSLSINYLDKNQRDLLMQLFYDVGISTPFYVSLDPSLCINNKISDQTKYVVFSKEPSWVHVHNGLYNMSFEVREVL